MASSKKRSIGKTSKETKPIPASIPAQPVPDFDSAQFARSVAALDPVAKSVAKQLAALLQGVEDIASRGPVDSLAYDERSQGLSAALTGLLRDIPALVGDCTRLQHAVEQWRASERRTRRGRFEAIAKQLQWRIVGSWPEPVINGIAFVCIDERKDIASLNGRPLAGPLTAERLATAISGELETLQSSLANPADFLNRVWRAYESAGGKPGAGVEVYDLIQSLTWQIQSKAFRRDPRAELFRGYSVAQFRADLTNALGSAPLTIEHNGKAYELQIVGGSFAQDGLFMYFPQTDRLATCGRLMFQNLERDQGK